jgi:hypothetical protein
MDKHELIELSMGWLDDVIDKCKRLTSGNVSHNAANLQGFSKRCAVYLTKHNIENYNTISEAINTFINIEEKASKLTSGNVSHQGSNIICVASISKSLLKLENKSNE